MGLRKRSRQILSILVIAMATIIAIAARARGGNEVPAAPPPHHFH